MIASTLKARERYALMTALIVPRAIAWVTTKDRAGHTNLAPFSYFTGLGSDPPLVTIGISDRRDGAPKDTLRIAKETGVLCINLIEEHDAERMNASSEDMPPEVSELDALGIETEPCAHIDCVRVKSSRASLECKLVDVHKYPRTNLVVAEIVGFDVRVANLLEVNPVARLQGGWYAKLGERFHLERP